jgi:U3 small nucleolar RNA-associated protein 11
MPGRTESPYAVDDDDDDDDDVSDDEEQVVQRPMTMSKKQIEAQEAAKREARKFRKDRERAQERTISKLRSIKKRERALVAAEEELELQRAKMNNTVGGVNKDGVKFKIRERKR